MNEHSGMEITVERIRFWQWAAGMVESTTEFDFNPGQEWSIPDDLRDRLIEWCADLSAWDESTRPLP